MERKGIQKKKFKKIAPLTVTRRLIQLASFILFPGLFLSTFSAIKSIYTALIGGTFSAAALAGQIVLVVSMLLITALMGRFFCGFLCSFGSMGDLFWYIGTKLKLPRPKIKPKVDRAFKLVKYVLLIGIIVLIWTFGVSILSGTSNPWTVFGMYASLKGWSDLTALVSIGAGLLLLIIVGSMFIERFFCRYLCPLGAVFAIVSRFRLFKIRKPRRDCGACRACTKRCPMGISLYRTSVVRSSECIDCMSCVTVCPRKNVTANPKPAFAAAIAVIGMSGMYYAGNLAGSAAADRAAVSAGETLSSAETAVSGQYIDGVYTGSATGYHGLTEVEVTVANGYITSVEVLSTGDDAEFFNLAKSAVIPGILSAQSIVVDTVSGATFSSGGILGAVSDALKNALNVSSEVQTIVTDNSALTPTPVLTPSPTPVATPTPTPTAVPTAAPTASGPIALADGDYSGTGSGFRGSTVVTVTVKDGFITAITIESYRDDNEYFSRAKNKVISYIIDAQSPDVDAVSGATYSSNGIMDAVADALGIDFTATQSSHRH